VISTTLDIFSASLWHKEQSHPIVRAVTMIDRKRLLMITDPFNFECEVIISGGPCGQDGYSMGKGGIMCVYHHRLHRTDWKGKTDGRDKKEE
jgi:hypothetical protein